MYLLHKELIIFFRSMPEFLSQFDPVNDLGAPFDNKSAQ